MSLRFKNRRLAEIWEIISKKGYQHFSDLMQVEGNPFSENFYDSVERGKIKPSDKALEQMKKLADKLPDKKQQTP